MKTLLEDMDYSSMELQRYVSVKENMLHHITW